MFEALILVDLQNDFCFGGSLAVKEGELLPKLANKYKNDFLISGNIVIATQDWHPQDHGSFASNHIGGKPFEMGELDGLPQVFWPDHCVQGTKGAEFHPDLDLHGVTIFRKGTNPLIDSYSAFYDNGKKKSTGLTSYLNYFGVKRVFVMGLATDYCVKATALDAFADLFHVVLLPEACRGVNIDPNDSCKAIEEMQNAGVIIDVSIHTHLRVITPI